MTEPNKPSKQERIWQVVNLIPKGKVANYGLIADLAGLPGRARFVSAAMRLAPASMQLPWHRVINAQGKISIPKSSPSYEIQCELLSMEGVYVKNGKVDLTIYGWEPDLADIMFQLDF